MEWAELKPLGRVVLLPPGVLVLMLVAGLVLVARGGRVWRRLGWALVVLQGVGLWLLGCAGFALWLHAALLPAFAPADARALAANGVQAVVVLGGGVRTHAPEYGEPQLGEASLQRLRLGVHLARGSGLPLAVSGGTGWASAGRVTPAEAAVAARVARDWFGLAPRWLDERSRDTRENAARMRELLGRDGVHHVALVTHHAHMARAARDFTQAGLRVTPAPVGFPSSEDRPLLRWLPSASGLAMSTEALREWLALRLT